MRGLRPPIYYALTCHVDQLDAEGFGLQDIERYVAWKRGKLRPPPDDEEIRRFGQLALLVILTDRNLVTTPAPPPVLDPLDMEPSPDFPDALEGEEYSETVAASGGIGPPYYWSATGVPLWCVETVSDDTTTWTVSGLAPMDTEMDVIALTLRDSPI
jgi:hypothetical protein